MKDHQHKNIRIIFQTSAYILLSEVSRRAALLFLCAAFNSMSTYSQSIYQLVFSTKGREPTLAREKSRLLYKYIGGVLTNKKCRLHAANGSENHLHLVATIHPTIAISNLVKDIKLSTTDLNKRENLFPDFNGWQDGFGAFTYSVKDLDKVIAFVNRQEAYHKKRSYEAELLGMLDAHGIEYDIRYVFQ